MLTFICLRVKSWQFQRAILRFHSAKPITRSMCPQEFSLENYECIGFDLDHTIAKYRLKPLFTLIYKTLASYLIEKYDYPSELSELNESDFCFAQKGLVLDKRRGNILKLDSQYRIAQATHGTHLLTREDICKIYGSNMIWKESLGVPHKLVLNNALDEPFYVFKDYFVTAGAAICAKLVDILDEKHGHPLEEYNFWDQYIEGILYMYERDNFKNNSGKFFPELKKNTGKYLRPCPSNVKKWLANLCENKVTFLLTSANYDAASLVAEFCLGEDWKKYFSVIVTFARKPGFFWKDKPFYAVSEDSEIAGVKPCDMQPNLVYSQGNFKDLLQICSKLSKTDSPKVAYFGDSLMEDVYAASELAGCDTIAIVEEMLAEGTENMSAQYGEEKILLSDFWGSFFSYNSSDKEYAQNNSLWTYLLSRHSRLTIPNLETISRLSLNDKVPCFGRNDSLVSGYFPGVPKALCSVTDERETQEVEQPSVRNHKVTIQGTATSFL